MLRRVAGPVVGPVYRRVIAARNRGFDAGKGVERLPLPVVSVGNLSTGGTGKTPVTAWLVRKLGERRVRAVIAMRGYKRDGEGKSDEAEEYGRLAPGVPVVADPRRFEAVTRFIAERGIAELDAVVLDDGFQHRQLHRDVDVVLVDATRSPFDDRLLPAGDLREPVESLARAAAVIVTHAESVGPQMTRELCDRVAQAAPGVVVAACRHGWRGVTVVDGTGERQEPLSWLASRMAMPVCAIGNPHAFVEEAEKRAHLVEEVVLADHDPYAAGTVSRVMAAAKDRGAEVVLTTEKDWSKLSRVDRGRWPCPVARVKLEMEFEFGEEEVIGVVMRGIGKAEKAEKAEEKAQSSKFKAQR